MTMWRGHPHDNGFDLDRPFSDGEKRFHEYGVPLGKYHTPAILFESYQEREEAFAALRAAGFKVEP